MTGRLNEDRLDREIRTYLAWQAEDIAGAPPATEAAARLGARLRSGAAGLRLGPSLGRVVLLAGLLLALVLGAIVGAGMVPPSDPHRLTWEAVFLRYGAIVDGYTDVHVVAVDGTGRERLIVTLSGASLPLQGPWGAVSPGGLLALARQRGETGGMMQWELFDLRRPQSDSFFVVPGVLSFYEQLRDTPYYRVNGRGGVSWGPGERLAILWYPPGGGDVVLQASFVDGRTGIATPVDIPNGLVVHPYWAPGGEGVFVSASAEYLDPPGIYAAQILRPQGDLVPMSETLAMPTCRMPAGLEFACLAPDDSMVFDFGGGGDASAPGRGLFVSGSDTQFAIDGSFVGWMEVDP